MRNWFIAVTAMLAISTAFANDIPGVEAFARLPALHSATLSPDGSKIAVMLANEKGYYDVAVSEFGKFEFDIVAAMKSPRDRIGYIRWANNEKLLVAASFPEDVGGYTYFVGKLYSIDIASGESVELKPRNFKTNRRARYADNTNLLTVLPDDPNHVLVGWRTEYNDYPTVFKVDVNDGSYDVYMSNEHEIDQWFSTRNGRITFGIQYDTKIKGTGKTDYTIYKLWIPGEDGKWEVLRTIDFLNTASFNPVSLSEDGKKLMVLSNHAHDELSLHKYDIASGEFEELVYHVDGYDIDNVLFQDEKVVGVTWVEDYVRQHYFNEREKQIFELVKQTFKGAEVSIASRDMADNRFLVYAVRDNMPGTYFLLDIEKKFAAPWFSQYPQLAKTKLAGNQPFRYTARDGMPMTGYFTPPVTGEKDAPLVVLPHGGPWARDNRYFDFLSQFISSRGYAVLQMNFRGSSGFGTAFERAGDKQWGQAMQTDVIDAIDWVKENKLADTENMCIVGASYGGYVALMAAALTPDMFKCAMSISGVTDIADRVEASGRLFGGEALYAKWVGDIDDPEDLEMLNRYSPINLIEKMTVPVLLFHGTNDSRVSHTQSRRFYDKAKFLGKKDVEYIEIKEATHFLDDGETRLKAMHAMEEFLEEHLQD